MDSDDSNPAQNEAMDAPAAVPLRVIKLRRGRATLLQFYRLGVLLAIVFLARDHHVRLRIDGDRPTQIKEVAAFLPEAAVLRADHSDRDGLHVHDATGARLGNAIRTSPISDKIIGYCGPSDRLAVVDADMKVKGAAIRHSWDTTNHVQVVRGDEYFMALLNGKTLERHPTITARNAGL